MGNTRGQIVDYTVPDTTTGDPGLTAGDVLPMIVVNVNEDGTESGVVFGFDGQTRLVHIAPEAPPEPQTDADFDADVTDVTSQLGRLTPAQRAELAAGLSQYDTPPPPPATDPAAGGSTPPNPPAAPGAAAPAGAPTQEGSNTP